jgi:rare lipoprotein A
MERHHPSNPALASATSRRSPKTVRLLGGARRGRQPLALAGLLTTAALISAACSGNHHPASPAAGTTIARGTASWYGPGFAGRPTASGEQYDMRGLTAAHPSLPFGTLVQVTNVENGRQVVVRINDRGPFSHGRIIDLSYGAARELDMVGPGTAEVELAVVGRMDPAALPAPAPATTLLAAAAPSAAISAISATSATSPISTASATSFAAPPATSLAGAAPSSASPAAAAAGAVQYTVQVGAFGEPQRADALRQDLAQRYPEAAVHADGIWNRVQIGLFGERAQAEMLRRELAALGLAAIVVTAR